MGNKLISNIIAFVSIIIFVFLLILAFTPWLLHLNIVDDYLDTDNIFIKGNIIGLAVVIITGGRLLSDKVLKSSKTKIKSL